MRDQLEMIVTSFQNNLSEISNSIVPILTKFNPEKEDEDIDSIWNDLKDVMQTSLEQFLIEKSH